MLRSSLLTLAHCDHSRVYILSICLSILNDDDDDDDDDDDID